MSQEKLAVVSQGFRYGEYGASASLSRTLRRDAAPLQFVVNVRGEPELRDQEVEVSVALRLATAEEPIFQTFWVTRLKHENQESALLLRESPPELRGLESGTPCQYWASVRAAQTGETAERTTRAEVR